MTMRTEKEMDALLVKFDIQLESLDKWSDEGLEKLNDWLTKTSELVTHEWVKRDNDSASDA